MSNILGSTFRKIFHIIHNPKKREKHRCAPDFQLQLIRSSSFHLYKPSEPTLEKESGSSQEPLISPKPSDSSHDETISEQFQNAEFYTQSKMSMSKS